MVYGLSDLAIIPMPVHTDIIYNSITVRWAMRQNLRVSVSAYITIRRGR